jgi:hypothetical protein
MYPAAAFQNCAKLRIRRPIHSFSYLFKSERSFEWQAHEVDDLAFLRSN